MISDQVKYTRIYFFKAQKPTQLNRISAILIGHSRQAQFKQGSHLFLKYLIIFFVLSIHLDAHIFQHDVDKLQFKYAANIWNLCHGQSAAQAN